MRARTRNLLLAALGAPLVLLAAALLWLSSQDLDEYRDDIGGWLSRTTGLVVGIHGGLELDLLPQPELRVRDLRLGSVDAGEPMLRVARVDLRVAALPLLEGRLVVPSLAVHEAELLIERDARGVLNWSVAGGGAEPGAAAVRPTGLVFERMRVDGLRIRYRDAGREDTLELHLAELNIASPKLEEALTLQGRGELAGAPLEVAMQLQTLAALLAGRETTLQMRVRRAGVTVRVDGSHALAGGGEPAVFEVVLEAATLGEALDLAGTLAPGVTLPAALPATLGALAPATLAARVRFAEAPGLRLDPLRLAAGESRLDGWLAVTSGTRPRVEGELRAPLLLLLDGPGDGTARGDARLFPGTPLPWETLDEVDLDLVLGVGELRLRGVTLSGVELPLRVQAGELVARPLFALAGGRVRGRVEASGATRGLSITLGGEAIDLGRLQRALDAGDEISGAPASLEVALRGAGGSAREVAASLDGEVLMQIGAGRVRSGLFSFAGSDLLLQAARSAGVGERDEMQLECGVARLQVAGGVARAGRGVGLRFNRVNLIGGGSVDLGAETLDLTLRLEPREGIGLSAGSTLASMVAVGGTLAEPRLTLDAGGVATTGAKVGAAIVTGGLSLLVGALVDRVTADTDPCATALASPSGPAATVEPGTPGTPAQETVRPRSKRDD